MSNKIPLQDRFWSRVDVRSDNECWEWQGYRDSLGYGKIGIDNNRTSSTHRVSWVLTFGVIPEGFLVCHSCDNPSCCNPNHLFLGTVLDNNQDRHRKGRTKTPPNKGEQNPISKLTVQKVKEIREHIQTNSLSLKEIASNYGIALNTVYGIKNKRTWKDV